MQFKAGIGGSNRLGLNQNWVHKTHRGPKHGLNSGPAVPHCCTTAHRCEWAHRNVITEPDGSVLLLCMSAFPSTLRNLEMRSSAVHLFHPTRAPNFIQLSSGVPLQPAFGRHGTILSHATNRCAFSLSFCSASERDMTVARCNERSHACHDLMHALIRP